MTAIVARRIPVACDDCGDDLWATAGPAGSLWCPTHGHIVDVLAEPPVTGWVHLYYGGKAGGEWVHFGDLR